MQEETKNTHEALLHKAYNQLSSGCGRAICLNPYCRRNPNFPPLTPEQCKDYILSLASTVSSRSLSKSQSFIFCNEPCALYPQTADKTSPQSYLLMLSSIENIGLLFLISAPTSEDPMINWPDFLAFTNELSSIISLGNINEDFILPLRKDFRVTQYARLYMPRSCILLLCLVSHLKLSTQSISSLCNLISESKTTNEQLSVWMDTIGKEMILKIMKRLQEALSHKVQGLTSSSFEEMIAVLKVMDLIWQSNNRKERVSYKEFYNPVINSTISVQDEYRKWRNLGNDHWKAQQNQKFSFIEYAWVIDCSNKTKLLQQENYELIEQEFNQFIIISLLSGGFISPYFHLEINRERMIEDTMQQISNIDINLKKPLKVKFIGEEGVDEGGVKKEFFQLIVKRIFDESNKMFSYKESNCLFWFNPNSKQMKHFELLGTLLGLAIYNGVNLDVKFPMALYKKLQNIRTTFKDLKEFDEFTVQSLERILELNDTQSLCLNFIVEFEAFGKRIQSELIEGGRDVMVNNHNKQDFANLYADWLLNTGIHDQFESFKRGFLKICGGGLLRLLRPEELELILCGYPLFDLKDLEAVAVYENGYSKDTLTVVMLWRILHTFDLDQQKKFLFFVTGSDRAPVNGLSSLHFVISRNGPDSDRLMTAHTCYNYLLLPEYTSEEKMRRLLLTAINNSEGFGLR